MYDTDFHLERISISRRTNYKNGEWIASYKGEVKMAGEHGSVEIVLNDEEVREVVRVCASTLVSVAKEAAARMQASVFDVAHPSTAREEEHP